MRGVGCPRILATRRRGAGVRVDGRGLFMLRKLLVSCAAASTVVLVTGMTSPMASASPLASAGKASITGTGPITDVSHACKGQNAEVEQATWHRHVYEAWMGCHNSIGFVRSADGGHTWSAPVVMTGSACASAPAVAGSPAGARYVPVI